MIDDYPAFNKKVFLVTYEKTAIICRDSCYYQIIRKNSIISSVSSSGNKRIETTLRTEQNRRLITNVVSI